MESAAMRARASSSSSFTAHESASRSRSSSSSSRLSGSGFSSRTNSATTSAAAALAAAFDDDDEFGAFATAGPPAAPALSPPAEAAPAMGDCYAGIFDTSSSSVSSLVPPPPAQFSSSGVSAFSQSGLSEISFADDEYDSPFADIVNEAPKSVGGSRTNSFSHISSSSGLVFESLPQQQQQTQASGGSIEIGSPLLSFSPVATPSLLSMPPSASSMPDIFSTTTSSSSASVDVFSLSASSMSNAPAEAELLSFSPLALSSSAPSAASSGLSAAFMLDSPTPAAVSSNSSSKPAPRFSLPPPRAATMPSVSPGAMGSVKAASFSGQVSVSVGELLSFSPVAIAPVSSFSDSIGSSAAATASIFGDDELFSLSTTDLSMDFSTTTAAAEESADAASPPAFTSPAAPTDLSPVAFGVSMIQDFTVSQSEPVETKSPVAADVNAEEEEAAVLPFTEPQVEVAEAHQEVFEFQEREEVSHQASPVSSEQQSPNGQQLADGFQEEIQHELSGDGGSSSSSADEDSGIDESSAVEDTRQASPDAFGGQRMSIPSPAGYSQFDFITQGFSPQASKERKDDASGKSPFASSSPLDTSQYQPFSQDSLGDQYTSMGDLSDEEFGGYSTTPVQSGDSDHLRGLNSTSTGSETANTPTGQLGGSEGAEYASFSSNDSDGHSPRVDDVNAHAKELLDDAFGESPVSTSPMVMKSDGESDQAAFGGFEIVSVSKPSEEQTEIREEATSASSSGVHNNDFGHLGESPSAATTAMRDDFDGFGLAANVTKDAAEDDEFGGFGAALVSEFNSTSFQTMSAAPFSDQVNTTDEFGGFSPSPFGGEAADDFGDFAQSSNPLDGDDDDFGDFGQSSGGVGDDDDFGDFGQSSSAVGEDDGFSDFQQSADSSGFGVSAHSASNDDDFGDFGAPPTPAPASSSFASGGPATLIAAPSSSKHDLNNFFRQAFPVHSLPTPLDTTLQVPAVPSHNSKDLFHAKQGRSNELIATIYRAAVESYFQDSSSAIGSTTLGTEHYSSELKALRLKHLKYVLTEKIQEASRHEGIFPHGSEKHHVLLSLVNSDDERKMRDALTRVQDSIFNSSVNDAMMRIARQAALSAKAKIAEQAAHQQASSRGSLLATTRQLLSRSGGGTGAGTTGRASDKDHGAATFSASSASLGVLTPTGASIHKISRFAFAGSGHDTEAASAAAASSNGNGSGGDDSGGENASDSGGRNSYNDDFSPHTPGSSGSGRNSGSGGSSSGGGGLMKKFQDRFSSFSSSRNRTRLVSLRRMGQSGEDVRKMELNMDSISGGLDEVKWKCAVFLYDVDEVAQVAPSQISILSYPSKEVLAGKSDRTALMKFLKPGAIWTIDIGASNNDVLNEW